MRKEIEIEKLIVNHENYRFDSVDNQSEAIDLMLEVKGEEILVLARHILEYGLDRAKDLRVLEIKKNLFLVLDGNRRITAIKCLNDPSLVKDQILRNKFLKIIKEYKNIPNKVSCFIYANEKEASEWIKLDHTGKNSGVGQDDWDPAGKERFDYKFNGKISPAMQIINLLQDETKEHINTKTLKISTINRILSNPESRSYLGIGIKNSQIVLVAKKKDVIDRLNILFDKIIVDDIAVKEVYHTDDSIKFMQNLFNTKPKLTKITALVPSGGTKTHKPKSIPRSIARNVLIPPSCVLQIHEPRLNNIYYELRSVQLDLAINAVAVLFRVFLETSLDCYASKNGVTFSNKTKLSGKITIVSDFLEKHNIAVTSQLTNIRKVATKGSILSIENFHEYVHSFKTNPGPLDLISKWDDLQEFFEILWADIAKKYNKSNKKI